MGRARLLKSEFFRNEALGHMPYLARLMFAGLLTLADREGRLEDRPGRIKVDLFPYDADLGEPEVNQGLVLLDQADLILRYEVNGEPIIQITKWKKHQRPHPREVASVLPSPPENPRRTRKPNLGKPKASHLMKLKPGSSGPSGPSGSSGSSGSSEKKPKPSLDDTTTTLTRARARTGAAAPAAPPSSSSASEGQVAVMAALRSGRARCIPDAERRIVEAAIAGATPAQIADCCVVAAAQKPKGFTANYVLGIVLNCLAEGFYDEPVPTVCAEAMPRYANGRRDELDSIAKDRKRVSDALTGRTRRAQTEADANVIDVPMPEVSHDSHRS